MPDPVLNAGLDRVEIAREGTVNRDADARSPPIVMLESGLPSKSTLTGLGDAKAPAPLVTTGGADEAALSSPKPCSIPSSKPPESGVGIGFCERDVLMYDLAKVDRGWHNPSGHSSKLRSISIKGAIFVGLEVVSITEGCFELLKVMRVVGGNISEGKDMFALTSDVGLEVAGVC